MAPTMVSVQVGSKYPLRPSNTATKSASLVLGFPLHSANGRTPLAHGRKLADSRFIFHVEGLPSPLERVSLLDIHMQRHCEMCVCQTHLPAASVFTEVCACLHIHVLTLPIALWPLHLLDSQAFKEDRPLQNMSLYAGIEIEPLLPPPQRDDGAAASCRGLGMFLDA